jgi:peptidoglycan/xylan/chitin deacetylase (PgdA/CDA1 family)
MKLLAFLIAITAIFWSSYFCQAETTARPVEKLLQPGSIARPTHTVAGAVVSHPSAQLSDSEVILQQCWNVTQLRGSALEKKVLRPTKPDGYFPTIQPELNPPVTPRLQNCIRHVQPTDNSRKIIALTFDVCERNLETAGYDTEIVNYLRDQHIKATFYAGGKWMHSHPERTKQLMADPLFELGNHAWTHGNMRLLTGEAMRQQILWTQAEYQQQRQALANQCPAVDLTRIPTTLRTFRFPYGTCSRESLDALASYGLPAIQWNIVTGDPSPKQTAAAIVHKVLHLAQSGSIIVAHANGRGHHTAQALREFIPQLQAKGFEFVTVSELLASGTAITTQDCYEETPGDNLKYDRLFGTGTE